jgi:tetratricopeptide (TPR) repeat protein
MLVATPALAISPQQPPPTCSSGIKITGTVREADGQTVSGATVYLSTSSPAPARKAETDATGRFQFSSISSENFRIHAEKAGQLSPTTNAAPNPNNCDLHLDLTLQQTAPSSASAESPTSMEFTDQPNFTIAGVTDWTAVGGHGSDSTLRTTETLANETRSLKPQPAVGAATASEPNAEARAASEKELRTAIAAAPTSFHANHQLGAFYLDAGRYAEAIPVLERAYLADSADQENQYDLGLAYKGAGDLRQARQRIQAFIAKKTSPDLCRLAAELDEQLGDPLQAVREFAEAAKLDPSEQNYFEWGSELLLHRAVWQALDILRRGADAYPRSVRMQTALGTALFAGARYDQAAQRLCAASDLNPEDPNPYLFMGRIQIAAPNPLACIEPRLKRFVQAQPASSAANYLYAMTLLKRQEQKPDESLVRQAETFLLKAVEMDPHCGEAYLELGNLATSKRSMDTAIHFYEQAIAATPQLADAHYRLGMAYDQTGQPAKAKEEFKLHAQIKQADADAIEKQRRELKQFLVVSPGAPYGNVEQ